MLRILQKIKKMKFQNVKGTGHSVSASQLIWQNKNPGEIMCVLNWNSSIGVEILVFWRLFHQHSETLDSPSLIYCPSPQLANRGTSALIDRGRGLLAKTEVSSNSHFEIDHQWSEQHHRDCFRHSESTVPGSLYSHLLETSSLNCGSLCHSYSLVIL